MHLGRTAWAPVYSNPDVRFQVNQIEGFKAFYALAYCNIHGLWGNSPERQWVQLFCNEGKVGRGYVPANLSHREGSHATHTAALGWSRVKGIW